jgi:hypothetical protein
MKMFQFCLLSQYEQIDLLYNEGIFIGKIRLGKNYKVLYQVNDFYVEITYQQYRYLVDEIFCFKSTRKLDPYLHQMEINHIYPLLIID